MDFNRNAYKSDTDPSQAKFDHHIQKLNSVHFEDPYDSINPTDNTH